MKIENNKDNSNSCQLERTPSKSSHRPVPILISIIKGTVKTEKTETENELDKPEGEDGKKIVETSPDGSVVRIFTFLPDGRKRTTTKLRVHKQEELKHFDMNMLNEYEKNKLAKFLDGISTANISAKLISGFIKRNTTQGKLSVQKTGK